MADSIVGIHAIIEQDKQRLQKHCPVYYRGEVERLLTQLARPKLKREEQFDFLEEANNLLISLEDEIIFVSNILRDRFLVRFPEIESLKLDSLTFARCVVTIGDTEDLTKVDFGSILPPTTALAMAMPASTTVGRPLKREENEYVLELALTVIRMQEQKKQILLYLEGKMSQMAPNVSAIVGATIASQLVGATGSVVALAKIPSGNIQVIGRRQQKDLVGMSLAHANPHAGYIYNSDLVTNTPPEYKVQAQRLVANKLALAARIDAQQLLSYSQGEYGMKLREEIIEKLEKLVEPSPMTLEKPIPPPPIESSKKRGGRRARKQKELLGQTQIRKMVNQMKFGQAEEEIVVGSSVVGLGELSSLGTGSGKIRVPVIDNRLREHLKKASEKVAKTHTNISGILTNIVASNGSTNTPAVAGSSSQSIQGGKAVEGTSTSMTFTPHEGIRLQTIVKPDDAKVSQKYFGDSLSFRKA